MTDKLSHINERGEAHMVDVGAKSETDRRAIAEGHILMAPETFRLIADAAAPKGDVIATARIAGIMAVKRTHELIPLCHPLAVTKVTVDFAPLAAEAGLRVTTEVRVKGQTGVEMEAMTGTSVACLTLYDMLKAADKAMTITDIRLVEKSGGRSGTYRAAPR
jgi:cyclic pyranopterin phosphate synthase